MASARTNTDAHEATGTTGTLDAKAERTATSGLRNIAMALIISESMSEMAWFRQLISPIEIPSWEDVEAQSFGTLRTRTEYPRHTGWLAGWRVFHLNRRSCLSTRLR
jgi:hypothetical protein